MGNFNINFQPVPQELTDASKVIFNEIFQETRWAGYDLRTGVTHGQQLILSSGFDVIGKAINGCVPDEVGDLTLTEKTINPVLIGGRFKYCAANQNLLNKMLKKAQNVFEDFFKRNPTEFEMKHITAVLMVALQGSIEPKMWFSDKQADTFANSGAFTNGTDLGLFNQFEGYWKQIFADGDIPVVSISENGGANYAAQVITPDNALQVIKDVYKKAPTPLRTSGDAEFKVSQSVYDALLEKITDVEAKGGLTKTLINGNEVLKYLGRPIVAMPNWDNTIMKYQNDGTKYFKPNRVVFTTPENLIAGTIAKEDLEKLDYKYDNVNNRNIIDFGYTLDVLVVSSDLIAVAY